MNQMKCYCKKVEFCGDLADSVNGLNGRIMVLGDINRQGGNGQVI